MDDLYENVNPPCSESFFNATSSRSVVNEIESDRSRTEGFRCPNAALHTRMNDMKSKNWRMAKLFAARTFELDEFSGDFRGEIECLGDDRGNFLQCLVMEGNRDLTIPEMLWHNDF